MEKQKGTLNKMTTDSLPFGEHMTNDDKSIDKSIDTWPQWGQHVLAELKRLGACSEKLELKIDSGLENVAVRAEGHKKELLAEMEKLKLIAEANKINLAVLKVKAGLWGALSGSLASIIAILIYILEFSNR